ncbi:MAG: hypothetical protein M4579_003348 [Chaenotheca gracillima]|nr:MAG: hypothetical protein M4579_003348 [Chaenotheca gracillima]
MDSISRVFDSPPARLSAVALASVGFGMFLNNAISRSQTPRKIIPSPRETYLPGVSAADLPKLPYPPDALPGARDVRSPYGTFRAYEWGPEEGRKVLLIHGISTPCIALGDLAHGLVAQGCRVILLDLWGRGYSDAPGDLQYDARLYTSQIFFALASSPLSWTGAASGRFAAIGYSMGGGIAASFTSHFPDLVSSLILLAPAGLLRPSRISYQSKFLYSIGIFPESFLEWLVKRRLRNAPNIPSTKNDKAQSSNPMVQELPSTEESETSKNSLGFNVDAPATVDWQIEHHQGFLGSFMSSIRFAPVTGQEDDWRRIGARLSAQKGEGNELGLDQGKVLLVLGEKDLAIPKDEVRPDAVEALGGEENVVVKVVDAGHELPITRSDELVGCIVEFWS